MVFAVNDAETETDFQGCVSDRPRFLVQRAAFCFWEGVVMAQQNHEDRTAPSYRTSLDRIRTLMCAVNQYENLRTEDTARKPDNTNKHSTWSQ